MGIEVTDCQPAVVMEDLPLPQPSLSPSAPVEGMKPNRPYKLGKINQASVKVVLHESGHDVKCVVYELGEPWQVLLGFEPGHS